MASTEDQPRPGGRRSRRRARTAPGGSRFAGVPADGTAAPASVVPPGAGAPLPEQAPRGARFAGAAAAAADSGAPGASGAPRPAARGREVEDPVPADRRTAEEEPAAARAAATALTEQLVSLHRARRSSETHILLCTATAKPPPYVAALAQQLEHAGLPTDLDTLLWEAASAPPAQLAALADAFAAYGRHSDCRQLLRQSLARPLGQVGATALALLEAGRRQECEGLLATLIRTRTPEEAAEAAVPAPHVLTPVLLDVARSVSAHHHRTLTTALGG